MRPSLLVAVALGLTLPIALPAQAQDSSYHLQLQVNDTIGVGGDSCRIRTGVIGTYPDSAARLPIGTPVDLILPCGAATARFFDARMVGAPGALQPAGPGALRPLTAPVPLPAAPAASPFTQPPPQQVLIAPTAPAVARPAPAFPSATPFSPRTAPSSAMPLPANPVAPSRPVVIQGSPPPAPVAVPPPVTAAPPRLVVTPAPMPAAQGADTATMRPDAAIVLTFGPVTAARTGVAQRIVLPTDPAYPGLLTELGGIAPGQTKPLPR
jgi:hypothetical protein